LYSSDKIVILNIDLAIIINIYGSQVTSPSKEVQDEEEANVSVAVSSAVDGRLVCSRG
jgi:hypothetical protein